MKEKTRKNLNIFFTVLFCIALVLFMISFSIGVPIYCRFFYYMQIMPLGLPEALNSLEIQGRTDWSYAEVKEAYDNCLNFCTLPWVTEFSCSPLKVSGSAAAHFADCKVLFMLDFWIMLSSGIVTAAFIVLNKVGLVAFSRPFGHNAYFLSAVIAVALPLVIILLILIVGFDKAFTAFHAVFFPGKTNWYFDYRDDEIINIMPEQFFMNCAIIIAVTLVVFAAALITVDLALYKKRKKNLGNT